MTVEEGTAKKNSHVEPTPETLDPKPAKTSTKPENMLKSPSGGHVLAGLQDLSHLQGMGSEQCYGLYRGFDKVLIRASRFTEFSIEDALGFKMD